MRGGERDACASTPIPRNMAELVALGRALRIPGVARLISNGTMMHELRLGDKRVQLYGSKNDKMFDLLRKEFGRDTYGLLRYREDDTGTLLDIGGHVGSTALFFHQLHPAQRLHVFEPAPLNFFYLAYNAMHNNAAAHMRIYHAGLTRDGASFTIEYSPDDTTSTRHAGLGHTWGKLRKVYAEVPAWSVGRLRSCVDLEAVSLIKLDCEGCEFDLVPSMPGFFESEARRIVGEFHEWHLTTHWHEANLSTSSSSNFFRPVRELLCARRNRGGSRYQGRDRIEWLRNCGRAGDVRGRPNKQNL